MESIGWFVRRDKEGSDFTTAVAVLSAMCSPVGRDLHGGRIVR
jgi:hypothetical protein